LPGDYYVATRYVGNGYIDEVWDNNDGIPCPGNCDITAGALVTVTGAATTTGIDFSLELGGRISGTITRDTAPSVPLKYIDVEIYDSNGDYVASG
jgi:hypothetical protein